MYDTFGGKNELFLRAIQHYRKVNFQVVTDLLQQEPNVRSAIQKLFELNVEQALEDKDHKGCFMVNTTTELVPHDKKIQDLAFENLDSFEKLLRSLLTEAQLKGELSADKDVSAMASYFFTLYNGIRVVGKLNPSRAYLQSVVENGLRVLD